MFNIVRKSIEWGGRTLELETGRIARQADGAVMVRYGKTIVLCTAVAAKSPKEGVDFFPLTVQYQEKSYAAGKIPGGYFKREGKPSEKETLVSRLIDRPIRPLFPEGFVNDTQVICTVLQHDLENDPDIVAMVGASAALAISGVPFEGPIGAAKVAYINDQYVLNPTVGFQENSDLELVVAGTKESVMMVESEIKELSEEIVLGAVVFAHKEMQPVIKMIEELAKETGKPLMEVQVPDYSELKKKVAGLTEQKLRDAYLEKQKQARHEKISRIKEETLSALTAENPDIEKNLINNLYKKVEMDIVRGNLIDKHIRIDGRGPKDIRQIECEAGILPNTHGSALFTRGETQALVVATLGTGEDEQQIDSLEGEESQHFMLHYNFPPFSVGETGPMRGPGRREIGHGKLAWRAIHPLMPSRESFPYTIRIVSEITESNGSSSMATVCGSSIALMDAGVPIERAVAGIAMGLIMEGQKYVVISDIMGDEDHLGDMDFKVAGTSKGITSLQMDIKIKGITPEIMKIALEQAHEGRKHILEKMAKAISVSRGSVNDNAPKITSITIPVDKIREVIGSGGKVIREICEVSGAKIDINDDGLIKIAAVDSHSAEKALHMINSIIAEPEVGKIYNNAKVVKVVDFGAFVEFLGKNQGLVHISELVDRRVESVDEIVREGDLVKVKVLGIDRQGKVKLSMRAVNQDTGEDISDRQDSRPRKTGN